MNWGKGLVIGLAAFMLFITVLVIQMLNAAEDSFDKDYYEKGINYDKDYLLKQQVITDAANPKIAQQLDTISVNFIAVDSLKVTFKRPSSSQKDIVLYYYSPLVKIPKANITKGEWKIILHWYANKKEYLFEQNLFIQ
jgi:hypothetical protein